MRAAQNGGLGMGHAAQKRLDMAGDQRLGQNLVALLDRVDDAAARLRLDIDTDGAKGQLALKGAAGHGGRGRKQRHMLDRDLARRGIVAPAAFGQRLDHRDKDAQHPLVGGQPGFLHALQGGGRGGIAGQNDQIAALGPKPLDARAGQVEDILGVAHAVRRVLVVAQIDQRQVGLAAGHGVKDRQSAQTRIEYAYRHN